MKRVLGKARDRIRLTAHEARRALRSLSAEVSVEGTHNEIDFRRARVSSLKMRVHGDRNVVRFHPSCRVQDIDVWIEGSDLRLELGERVKVSQSAEFRLTGSHAVVQIEADTSIEQARFVAHGGTQIVVGPDCMLAYGIELRTTDAHSVIDEADGRRINQDASIRIGEHVWLGARAIVLKGVTIGDRSIVGAGATVTRSVGSGVVAAGNPAREIRRGVTWDRRLL